MSKTINSIAMKPGRYFLKETVDLLRAIHRAAKESRVPTDAERRIGYLDFSLGHDFHESFRPREHGMDAFSVARRDLPKLEATATEERRIQELAYLRSVREALDSALRSVDARIAEVDSERGSVVHLENQRAIAAAKQRIEKRRAAV